MKHWGDLFHFWQVLHFDYVKLFNIFISSVKTGILSLNVGNIEGTYFTSEIFLFWQCEIIQYIHFKCKNWYFKFKYLKHCVDLFHSSSMFLLLTCEIIQYVFISRCKNWYFKSKCLKHSGDLVHFWHVFILTMSNYSTCSFQLLKLVF